MIISDLKVKNTFASGGVKYTMVYVIEDRCDYCGVCVSVCPPNVIELKETNIKILEGCTNCKLCIYVCPYEVIKE